MKGFFSIIFAASLSLPAGQALGQANAAKSRVTDAWAAEAAPTLRISVAPPSPKSEVKGPAPSPNHIWIPGYWEWQKEQHVWIKGRWESPRKDLVWLTAQWVYQRPLWNFYPGRFSRMSAPAPAPVAAPTGSVQPQQEAQVTAPATGTALVTTKISPPPHRDEIPPEAPSPQHEWIGGHWFWKEGHFVWVAGHFEQKMADWTFVRAHWVQQGPQWRLLAGEWHKK